MGTVSFLSALSLVRKYLFPHLIHKEIEAQSGQVTWLN